MTTPLYDDGRYFVSSAIVSTPTRVYPIANTTVSIRRDPLWVGLGITTFTGAAIFTYGDLLYPLEIAAMTGLSGLALFVGLQVLILRIDAAGHRRALIVSTRGRIRRIFAAIRLGRTARPDQPTVFITTD